jgi:hypothetical protein
MIATCRPLTEITRIRRTFGPTSKLEAIKESLIVGIISKLCMERLVKRSNLLSQNSRDGSIARQFRRHCNGSAAIVMLILGTDWSCRIILRLPQWASHTRW